MFKIVFWYTKNGQTVLSRVLVWIIKMSSRSSFFFCNVSSLTQWLRYFTLVGIWREVTHVFNERLYIINLTAAGRPSGFMGSYRPAEILLSINIMPLESHWGHMLCAWGKTTTCSTCKHELR